MLWHRRVCSTGRNDDAFASPAIGDGRALFSIDVIADRPTDAGREIALNAATGAPVWSFSPLRYRGTGGGISGTPAIDARRGRRVAAVGDTLKSSRYVMLDELSGALIWQRQLEPATRWMQSIGTPASTGGVVVVPLYHTPTTGALIALRGNDGVVIWRVRTGGIYGTPVIWHGIIIAALANECVVAFDLRNGRPLGRLPVSSELYGRGLAIDGDTLFVAGRGAFWAYRVER